MESFFINHMINLSSENGAISFITTNYFLTADGAVELRKDMYLRTTPVLFVNLISLKYLILH